MKSTRTLLKITLFFLIFGLGLALLPNDAEGQTNQADSLRRLFSLEPVYRDFSEPVDPNLYLIRPGDIITASFIGSKIPQQSFTVDPEGHIVEPSLGVIALSGKTLSQARTELTKQLSKIFNSRDIAFSISKPRLIPISVTGEVVTPGTYTLYSSQRASEAIAVAGGVLPGGSTRRIHFDGGVKPLPIDLDRASYLGDLQFDPPLYAGMKIIVPARSQSLVHVVGEVNNPRAIELLPDDSLNLLLALAGGVTSYGDASALQIAGGSSGHSLTPGTTVMVPELADLLPLKQVLIFGAVAHPGRYDTAHLATLGQLAQAAGGFLPDAVQERSVVFRRIGMNVTGQLTDTRYPIVFVDQQAFNPDAFSLQPGDSVVVPKAHGFVHVSGEVRNPGTVPFVQGKTVDWYVTSVGGFSPKADNQRMYIHHPIANIVTTVSRSTLVRDGDEIIVEVREEFK